MDQKVLMVAVAAFLVFSSVGFYAASSIYGGGDDTTVERFVQRMNTTVDSDTELATARFDGRSLDLMHEDRRRARFYLDLDRDGSFDIELDDLNRTGEVEETTEVVTLENRSYRLFLEYRDDAGKEKDSFLTLYLVRGL